jgi:phosphate-selective porin OprO/OprP
MKGLRFVMKMGKLALMTGAAVVAILAGTGAQAATKKTTKSTTTYSAPQPVQQTAANDSNAELAARVQALEDALSARDERMTGDRTRLSTLEQNYNSAVWSFDNGRPTFASGDGRFSMAIRARFQTDYANFSQSATHPAGFAGANDLSSGAVLRRAYFGIEGKAFSDFMYEIRLNAGGADGGSFGAGGVPNGGEGDPLLNKAVITYVGIPNWHFNVGVIEPAFMMEGTTSSANLMFLERPEIENIAADTYGAGDSRRGIEIGWAKTDALWAGDNITATGTFSGGKTGSAQNHGSNVTAGLAGAGDENTQVLGRVTDRLWSDGISNLQIGGNYAQVLYSGSNGNIDGGSQTLRLRDRPEVRVDGSRLIDTGAINAKTGSMFAFDIQGNWENFFVGAEYAQFTMDRQCFLGTGTAGPIAATILPAGNPACTSATSVIDHPKFSGYTVEASWIITGETKGYSASAINNEVGGFQGPVPSRPFSLAGGSWGAWELVARYSGTDLNYNRTQLQTAGQLPGIIGGDEQVLALGVNWYLNRNIRLMVDDNIIKVSKGIATNLSRDSQNINALGVRLQFAN